MWHDWQKRIVICRIVEECPKTNLELLKTSLEPILHLDFSSSLSPLMAALHHEGANTFRIQRAADYNVPIVPPHPNSVAKSELSLKNELSPHDQALVVGSKSHPVSVSPIMPEPKAYIPLALKPEPLFLPAIQNTHTKHKPTATSSDLPHSTTASHLSSSTESFPLRRSYNSVPDIRSSVDLLTMAKRFNITKRKHRSKTLACTGIADRRLVMHRKHHQLELYKTQLSCISQVYWNQVIPL